MKVESHSISSYQANLLVKVKRVGFLKKIRGIDLTGGGIADCFLSCHFGGNLEPIRRHLIAKERNQCYLSVISTYLLYRVNSAHLESSNELAITG